ncbi:hypothetical protein GGX14DRAFT_624906 [Mycena pura]|uniref:Protein kinase domain-containing protein n=1 Tax=Mycena pura TaxID=153505 RepID=A0AAD6YAU4_9AGAR|nr:hypothetical protein GGX14DRAFT_624906 [Mycena pura]
MPLSLCLLRHSIDIERTAFMAPHHLIAMLARLPPSRELQPPPPDPPRRLPIINWIGTGPPTVCALELNILWNRCLPAVGRLLRTLGPVLRSLHLKLVPDVISHEIDTDLAPLLALSTTSRISQSIRGGPPCPEPTRSAREYDAADNAHVAHIPRSGVQVATSSLLLLLIITMGKDLPFRVVLNRIRSKIFAGDNEPHTENGNSLPVQNAFTSSLPRPFEFRTATPGLGSGIYLKITEPDAESDLASTALADSQVEELHTRTSAAIMVTFPVPFPLTFLDGVEDALKHLHSLGCNDINPSNIMLSKAGDPIVIDFDSCLQLGQKLNKGATPNWEYEGNISAVDNDLGGEMSGHVQDIVETYRRRDSAPSGTAFGTHA